MSLLSLDPRLLRRAGRGAVPEQAVAVTRYGYALRFRLAGHAEPSTRRGRRFARLKEGDEVVGVVPTLDAGTLIVATEGGRALLCDVEEINLLAGSGLGVRAISLMAGDRVLGFRVAYRKESLTVTTKGGQTRHLDAGRFRVGTRGRRGTQVAVSGFAGVVAPVELPEPLE